MNIDKLYNKISHSVTSLLNDDRFADRLVLIILFLAIFIIVYSVYVLVHY